MRRKRFGVSAAVGLAVGACLSIQAGYAAEVSASGTVTYIATPMGQSPLGDGRILSRVHLKGMVVASDPSVSLHLASQDCVGTTLLDAGGVQTYGAGTCDGVDADGNTWWIWWRNTPQERTWSFIGGTGKFEGVSGGGTTKVLGATEDGRLTISWEGRWSTK